MPHSKHDPEMRRMVPRTPLNKWASELSFSRKIIILLTLPLLVNILLGLLFVSVQSNWRVADRLVFHSNEILSKTDRFFRNILESQLHLRGLVLLQKPEYETRLNQAREAYQQDLHELRTLIGVRSDQAKLFEAIVRDTTAYDALLASVTKAFSERKIIEAMNIVRDLTIENEIGAIRADIRSFTSHEEKLYRQRREALQKTYHKSLWAVGIGCFSLFLITIGIALLFNRILRDRFTVLLESVSGFFAGTTSATQLEGSDEFVQLERAFFEVSRSLAERSAENEAFIYSVSHDMRSPLVNIQGFAEELKFSLKDLEVEIATIPQAVANRDKITNIINNDLARAATFIAAAVGRLSLIIDSLLKLSRAGRVEYHLQICDTNAIIHKILQALQGSIDEKEASIEVDTLPSVYADPGALDQIFSNILSNAVKYLNPARPGKIKVGIRWDLSSPETYTVYVNDNGMGFPESFQKKLFLPFQRFHATVVGGEGVGLALVSRIVERMRGQIWAESVVGEGSTFFVRLPAFAPVNELLLTDSRH